jgi:hypothetical protein
MGFLNGAASFVVDSAVESGQRIEVERQGKIVVSRWFLAEANRAEDDFNAFVDYSSEAKSLAERYGSKQSSSNDFAMPCSITELDISSRETWLLPESPPFSNPARSQLC